mgnify:CR=1 FL=1
MDYFPGGVLDTIWGSSISESDHNGPICPDLFMLGSFALPSGDGYDDDH